MGIDTVIQTVGLTRYYGKDETRVAALTNVDLSIDAGEFTAIVGPSGSGKSTLLHLIGGLDTPSSGRVELGGTNIAEMSGIELSDLRRDQIGFIFQAYNLIPVLSARENIEYVMLLQGMKAAERNRRTDKMLKQLGIEELGDRRPAQMSGGQQQRVAVARAMASGPAIIFADEPTANLDSKTGVALLDLMRKLNEEERITFVFSTHDQKIMDIARRLVHLRDGVIESEETR